MPNQSKSLKTYSRYKSIFTTPASQGGDIVSNALPRTFADLDLYPHDPGSSYKKDGLACHKKAKHSKLVHFCDEIVTLNAHTQNGCMRGVSCGSDGSRSRDPAFPTGYFSPSLNCTANQLKKAVEEKPEFYKSSFLSQIPKNELKMSDSENNLQIDLDRMSSEDKSAAEKEINELNSRPKAPPPQPSTPKSHSKPEAPEDSSLGIALRETGFPVFPFSRPFFGSRSRTGNFKFLVREREIRIDRVSGRLKAAKRQSYDVPNRCK